jgi:hypothetical protein
VKFYCGIDLGARKTHVCHIDEDNHKLLDMKMGNDFEESADRVELALSVQVSTQQEAYC